MKKIEGESWYAYSKIIIKLQYNCIQIQGLKPLQTYNQYLKFLRTKFVDVDVDLQGIPGISTVDVLLIVKNTAKLDLMALAKEYIKNP